MISLVGLIVVGVAVAGDCSFHLYAPGGDRPSGDRSGLARFRGRLTMWLAHCGWRRCCRLLLISSFHQVVIGLVVISSVLLSQAMINLVVEFRRGSGLSDH
jgi:hypothetical protein